MKDVAVAEGHLVRTLVLHPDDGVALHGLGVIRRLQGQIMVAADLFRRAAVLTNNPAPSLTHLAACLRDNGQDVEASRAALQAILLDPACSDAWFQLALLMSRGSGDARAITCLDRSVASNPHNTRAHAFRAAELRRAGHWRRTLEATQAALQLAPDAAHLYGIMAGAECDHGRVSEALRLYQRALAQGVQDSGLHSNMLMAQQYAPDMTADALRSAHEAWGARHAAGQALEPSRYTVTPDPCRRIRIGFVSGDFRTHSVTYFLMPLLEALDRNKVEVFCFSATVEQDHVTRRAAKTSDHWFDVARYSDRDLAGLVRTNQIDILIDLSGHTRHNRLTMFAYRPAPVQITWLGYPGTTGVAAIDYRLTDAIADPPGPADGHCTERLLRLEGPFLCYQPPRSLPPLTEPPAVENGVVTFGSFNNIAKVTPAVIAVWARILGLVDNSRLILKSRAFQDSDTCRRFVESFSAHGVAVDRIDLLGHTSTTGDHLAAYGSIDIALDTFPYNGTTTTCEALAMGVPVIVLAGTDHRGRVGTSLLRHAGMDDLVAEHEDEYVAIAQALAAAPETMRGLRRTLRSRLLNSAVCDAARHARSFETALGTAWRAWCAEWQDATDLLGIRDEQP